MARFEVGKLFASYSTLDQDIKLFEREQFIQLYKKESRTIAAAQKRCPNKSFNEDIKYSEIAFACVHNGKYKSKATSGERPNQKTGKIGCEFVIKFRATADGQHLMCSCLKDTHSHEVSEMAFKFHPKQRKLSEDTQAEIANLCKLQANKKLMQ